jgi:glycosyltransferase involved in cell wall biosynthesis
MRVLFFSSYITNDKLFPRNKNRSGYGIVCNDIITALSSSVGRVYVLTQSIFTKRIEHNNITFVTRRYYHLIQILAPSNFYSWLRFLIKYKVPINKFIRIAIYFSTISSFKKTIKVNDIQIINIHGVSPYTYPIILESFKSTIPVVITLHGINQLNNDANMPNFIKIIEKDIFELIKQTNIQVVVISSGIKDRLVNNYNFNPNRVNVITNGIDISNTESITRSNDRKIFTFICVGNITTNKNQKMIVDAFDEFSKSSVNAELIIIGKDTIGDFAKYVANKKNPSINYLGEKPRAKVIKLYKLADFTITGSYYEGFGMSIIEGFSFGLPAILCNDLDIYPDVSDSDLTVAINYRSVSHFVDGMSVAVKKSWNKKEIINKAKKFNLKNVSKKYYDTFKVSVSS